jgi:hypothetical protein
MAILLRSAMGVEPAHHQPVEDLGEFDIGEMPGLGDLLIARAGNELGDAAVAGRRRALVVAAADD